MLISIILTPSKILSNNENKFFNDQEEKFSDNNYKECNKAEFIVIDKVTAKSKNIILDKGQYAIFCNLKITLHRSIKKTDIEDEEMSLITAEEMKIEDDPEILYQGWLFKSSPSLSTMEHPVYEIIMLRCL